MRSGRRNFTKLIRRGGRVIALESGGAIMRKLGEDSQNVRLTLSGFTIKVQVEDPSPRPATSIRRISRFVAKSVLVGVQNNDLIQEGTTTLPQPDPLAIRMNAEANAKNRT